MELCINPLLAGLPCLLSVSFLNILVHAVVQAGFPELEGIFFCGGSRWEEVWMASPQGGEAARTCLRPQHSDARA